MGRVPAVVIVAVGVNTNGRREVLGMDAAEREAFIRFGNL